MNPQQGREFVVEKYLQGAVSKDRLVKAWLMCLFLIMDVNSLNSYLMSWNGPDFSFGSITNGLLHIN